jgi:dienelactone hydrolase
LGVWPAVDLGRVAMVGHSAGGATALLTAELDRRVAGAVCWDACIHPGGPLPPALLAG